MRIVNTPTQAKSWRDKLKEIKSAKQAYFQYSDMMSPYQQQIANDEINDLYKRYAADIRESVLSEHETAIQKLKGAHEKVQAEKKNEIARWDASKLAAEMQVYQILVDQAIQSKSGSQDWRTSTGDRLEKLFGEAKESGDIYKQRAACEVMTNITGKVQDPDTKLITNRFEQQARQELEKVRTTSEYESAIEKAEEVWNEYRTARQELITTSREIGEGDPLHVLARGPMANAVRRVQIINNEIKIFEPDAPEIYGEKVDLKVNEV